MCHEEFKLGALSKEQELGSFPKAPLLGLCGRTERQLLLPDVVESGLLLHLVLRRDARVFTHHVDRDAQHHDVHLSMGGTVCSTDQFVGVFVSVFSGTGKIYEQLQLTGKRKNSPI